VCNRDESRLRPPAAAPKWRSIGETSGRAIWPMDLEAGGTWIGAAETGLCLCLLNLNLEPPISLQGRGKLRSRGLIIPDLLGAASLTDAAERLRRINLRHFAPFRLLGVELAKIAGGEPEVLAARWDRVSLDLARLGGLPLCFVSSGLGDSLVLPRLELFEATVVSPGTTPDRQDEFHRHVWSDRPEISVLMSRADARTVSVTTLEVGHDASRPRVTMTYEPVCEAAPATDAGVMARSLLR
jgi:hypothetical protein